jgi:hypothetical protein
MPKATRDSERNYGEIVKRAWLDEAFRERLKANPRAVLRESGVEVPDRIEIRVIQNTPEAVYLMLPPAKRPRPASGELTDKELERVAGGCDYGDTCWSDACGWSMT